MKFNPGNTSKGGDLGGFWYGCEGSFAQNDDDNRYVAVLHASDGRLILGGREFCLRWFAGNRFLLVRKKALGPV